MKTAKVTLADATYYLAFDGEAMFTLRDDFGGTQLALEAIEQDTRESFAATCAIAAVLAERGDGREVTSPADDEIDEGLAELNQKKTR